MNQRHDITRLHTRAEVARLLHVGLHEIDNLLARLPRYYRIRREPKPNGGFRILMIPMGKLRLLQDKIQRHILSNIIFREYVQGGVKDRSCRTNAQHHIKKQSVLAIDIKNYFPSIRPETVIEVFKRLGFEDEAAKLLARLTTYKHQLPQGAPTSPAISNLAAMRIDVRFQGLAAQQGFSHTRFIDDITLSGSKRLKKFANLAKRIVHESGFQLKHGDQIDVIERDRRQTVTKLAVNRKVNVTRETRDSILKQVAAATKAGVSLSASLQGKFSWLRSVNPNVGKALYKAQRKRDRQIGRNKN